MAKSFRGIRRRVEGERARFAVNAVREQGFFVVDHGRLSDGTGYFIRTKEGPAINYYDTGTITVTGTNRRMFGDLEALRMPDMVRSILVVAPFDDENLLQLCKHLRTLGIVVDTALFSEPKWMKDVALARRRGMHVLAFISNGPDLEYPNQVLLDAYFGLGLLVARLDQEHLTVLCDDSVQFPNVYGLMVSNLMRFSGDILAAVNKLRTRFLGVSASGPGHGKASAA